MTFPLRRLAGVPKTRFRGVRIYLSVKTETKDCTPAERRTASPDLIECSSATLIVKKSEGTHKGYKVGTATSAEVLGPNGKFIEHLMDASRCDNFRHFQTAETKGGFNKYCDQEK